MFDISFETVGIAFLGLIFMAFCVLCTYPNLLRMEGKIEAWVPEMPKGTARMRIEVAVAAFLSGKTVTQQEIIAALTQFQPEDVHATLVVMLGKKRLLEQVDERKGYLYSVP